MAEAEGVAEICKNMGDVLVAQTQLFYKPRGLLRECTQWDERGHRFLVSMFEGGMGAVPYHPGPGQLVPEQVLVSEAPHPGLSNLGFRIDYPRNRVVSCASDKVKNLLSTIVAYDYTTWETLFVVELAGPEAVSLADDLTIGPDGEIYVTDGRNGKIWKVKSDGSEFHVFSDSPLYHLDPISDYYEQWKLNGIRYHPDGFLLVAHLGSHALFKVSMDAKRVIVVAGLDGRELLGDGFVLKDKHTMALTGLELGVHLLDTKDNWESATVTHVCPPPTELLATSASLKDGQIFIGFANGFGDPYTCTIGQPIFRPLDPNHPEPPFPPPRRPRNPKYMPFPPPPPKPVLLQK